MAQARLSISFGFDFSDMVRQLREAADRLEALQTNGPAPTAEDTSGPAKSGTPRCAAALKTKRGTAACWRAATHNPDNRHCGETETGYRFQWTDQDTCATPHRTTTACDAYVPPPGKPEDSGCCARCGMYDWRHGEQPAEPAAADWHAEP